MDYLNQLLHGDCEEVMKQLPDNSIDLIFTSPPYADQRQTTYGGVSPDQYVDWLLPKCIQLARPRSGLSNQCAAYGDRMRQPQPQCNLSRCFTCLVCQAFHRCWRYGVRPFYGFRHNSPGRA